MKFSKKILFITMSIFLTITSSHASEIIGRTLAKNQQLNPGLDAQVKIVSMHIQNDLTYNIVKLPINGTLYYDGIQITEVGAAVADPNKLTIDPKDGDITVTFEYTSTDPDGVVSEEKTVIMPFSDLLISGSVFHDFDGNSKVDGERISHLNGEALYVTLINKEEKILSSKAVSKEGRYSFNNSDGIQPNMNYAVVISTKKDLLNSELPAKWASSGENINSLDKGKDERKDSTVVVNVREKDITDIDFGLDVKPLAKDKKHLTQLNPGGNQDVVVPKLEGSDEENGEKVRYFIISLPENATLYDNGKKLSKAGVEIKDISRLTLDPDNNDQLVLFTYVTADNAGVISNPATVTLPFAGLVISGMLVTDGNGDVRVNGKPISHIGDVPMYATLLNENKNILASTSIAPNGKYKFDGTNHIVPNSTYYVVISTQPLTTTSTLPANWNNSGEGVMYDDEAGNDGNNDGIVEVEVNIKDVRDVNFAVNHKPLADNITVQSQLNPGDLIQVPLPALSGSDDESAERLIYTLTALANNATLYYDTKKITKANFVILDPSKLTIDPEHGERTIEFSYTVTDEADITSDPATVSITFKELKLSGNVLNDGDGDSEVNGKAIYLPEGNQLYALLLSTDQTVLASKAIEKDGTYVFDGKDGVKPDTEFFIILATSPDKNHFGLPKGWNNTGETIRSLEIGKDTAPDGVIAVNVVKTDVENIDFGINQKPTAQSQDIAIQLNPGLDTQVNIPALTGNDKESGTELIYKIESLPTLGSLYYDGIKVENIGFIIEETDKLSLDPQDGDKVVLFSYATTDQAGVISDPVRVEMAFKGLTVSGNVMNDGDGDTKVKGELLYNPGNSPLHVTLLNENGSVLASKILNEDASYRFSGEDGVRPNAYYSIVISTKADAQTSLLPEEWANSGEVVNAEGESKDLTVDGIVNVHVLENNVQNVDFGIDKKPTADNKTAESQVNPGGTQTVPVPILSGNDKESGTNLRYMIKSISKNATLYDNKVQVSKLDLIDPDSLTLDPKDGKQTVILTYVSIDQEGNISDPATVTMLFTGLRITGRIFEDFVINGNVDGAQTVAADKAKFYVTLLNEKGEIMATVPTLKDGSYLFNEINGVNAHTNYTLVLSKDQNATTSILVEGWNHADGENVNSLGKGNDGKADGMIDVSVKDTDLKQVDFGINYLIQ